MTVSPLLALQLVLATAGRRPWFEERLAAALLREGPQGLLFWQWLAVPIFVVVALVLGYVCGGLSRWFLRHLIARAPGSWDRLLTRLSGPLTAFWALASAHLLSRWMALGEVAEAGVDRVLRSAAILAVFWAVVRAVDISFLAAAETPWAKTHSIGVGLLPIGRKVSKVAVVALGLVTFLTELGYPVASLLAGLGLGGLALALAAQKTVENLFGSVSIGIDQPFRVGDFVRVDGVAGNVESVGLRSTRIRTLDRTVVNIPNGKLAEMRTETFAPRDRIRLACSFGLVHSTTALQMRAVLGGVEKVLHTHPAIWPEEINVRFVALSPSSLDVEVTAWFQTSDGNQFLVFRQDVLLQIMEVVERAGTRFAFPTHTVHLAQPIVEPGSKLDQEREKR